MDKRLLLAVALMIGVMVVSTVAFPPRPRSPEAAEEAGIPGELGTPAGSPSETEDEEGPDSPESAEDILGAALAEQERLAAGRDGETTIEEALQEALEAPPGEEGVVVVRSNLYEYRFSARGAALVGATMLEYENFAAGVPEGTRVDLLRPDDALLQYGLEIRDQSVSLASIVFEPSALQLDVTEEPAELRFEAPVGQLTFDVTYRFVPSDYRIEVTGGLRGLDEIGHAVAIGLGRGLAMNEALPSDDRSAMALVTRSRSGEIVAERLDRVDNGEVKVASGGPYSWAGSKSKYWLAAIVVPPAGPALGGAILEGVLEPNAAEMRVTFPVVAGAGGFEFLVYVGPQDFARLKDIGQELHNLNPSGWSWLRWLTRPLGNLIVALIIWMNESFSMAYGWILILIGVGYRTLLLPLYQISTRQQMKQMALTPEVNRIKEQYKGEPQRMQQEMGKLYRAHGVNPIGGCLPMLLPFPILITLFFVFQNTIEFRGVPFLWIPDLSLRDPYFIMPALMGGSMLLLNWITQRGMQTNMQMKMISYALPAVFTFVFINFAAGLNLYYTALNFASFPQQIYMSNKRRKAQPTR